MPDIVEAVLALAGAMRPGFAKDIESARLTALADSPRLPPAGAVCLRRADSCCLPGGDAEGDGPGS